MVTEPTGREQVSIWQELNAPRNKRERSIAKIASDIERERIIELLYEDSLGFIGCGCCAEATVDEFIALINGENK